MSLGKKLSPYRKVDSVSAGELAAFRKRLLGWYARHGRSDLPWRKKPTPYRVLVAEVMLQQTQAGRVIEYYRHFLKQFPNLQALASAKQRALLSAWSGLGYNRRVLNLQRAAKLILLEHKGRVPKTFEELLALPGVGTYTVHAINIFSRNADEVCIDTNVRRVYTTTFNLSPRVSDSELSALACRLVPKGKSRNWHNALMDYGALVATSRKTKVSPRTKQSSFVGSRRQKRGEILRYLLQQRGAEVRQIAHFLAVSKEEAQELLQTLVRENFLQKRKGRYVVH
ncbi:Fe-S cluster assembly protein HesB [Candidatus Uhrbacteria bacterium CG10_big_fil_rev_8_21_14_0_10_48_11]|uniref:Adenine DNA glycosylase n=1 Tax=Candidatus Uhrbacteria bacterium CG10_big_fil_rev_8_21_14_0_10_48_11 TaxID=1975037 RepID=A0A2M8LEV6_9BACT|nr:MAG: Fe-S cluster assembly protein HesB [Candidatus Uhrbacteria bacterium CG10_big_fil_rev_8_21_14_0_10_48_11]